MAYNNSGELPIGQSYQLGAYTFSLTATPDPGEGTTGINVRCDKGDERAVVSGEVTGTVESWSVEANETEASVYVRTKGIVVPHTPGGVISGIMRDHPNTITYTTPYMVVVGNDGNVVYICASDRAGDSLDSADTTGNTGHWDMAQSFVMDGNTVYYTSVQSEWQSISSCSVARMQSMTASIQQMAWAMVYGPKGNSLIVARFAIDIREAGGGPGGGWDEPGDTGDPSYTLNVNVTGATAGTHDAASVPMAPADQPVYGSGGAGGNGGGGGAGQSTVIERRFATDKAGSVNQEVTLRPPGVGSKGSPGGRGGDGCILIFW